MYCSLPTSPILVAPSRCAEESQTVLHAVAEVGDRSLDRDVDPGVAVNRFQQRFIVMRTCFDRGFGESAQNVQQSRRLSTGRQGRRGWSRFRFRLRPAAAVISQSVVLEPH